MNAIKDLFMLDPEVVFLNHGSFGACPIPVFEAYQNWQRKLERQPVAFMTGELVSALADARTILGQHINALASDIVFVPNATFGVNVIAHSILLEPGDEILATDHEYGACRNAWEFVCRKSGAAYKQQSIPLPVGSSGEIVEALWQGVTARTKLIFMSHITSPTAVHFPVEEVCARAREAGILSLVDGAHSPGQIPLDLQAVGADFYTGNCHKWLMAPKGSAFLYTRPDKQSLVQPLIVSWGWGEEKTYRTGSDFLDNLQWWGTRDSSAYLSVPTAIQFQSDYDWDTVREVCHELVNQAIHRISELVGKPSIYPDHNQFHQMAVVPLPHIVELQEFKEKLFSDHHIEIPCIEWNGMQFLRLSIQGYNSQADVDKLMVALQQLIPEYSES